MNKFINIINSLALYIVKSFGTLLICLLAINALFLTCYAEDMTTQLVLTKWDNLLLSLLGTGFYFWESAWSGNISPATM